MRYWVTPFSLSATAWSTLHDAGLQAWPGGELSLAKVDSLLLFDSPDQLIAMAGSGPNQLTARGLLEGYRRLLDWSEQTGQPLLSISQLQRLGPQGLRTWIADGNAAHPSPPPPPAISPLLASVALSLLQSEPALLDCYHDLELRAELLGRDPDLRYRERLLQASHQGEALLQAFLASQQLQAASAELGQRLASRDTELRKAREGAELTLEQLGQVQEELEHYYLADSEKQRQLEDRVRDLEELRRTKADQERAHSQELQALRQQFEPRLAELEQHLARKEWELRAARDAAEMSLLQLRQNVHEIRAVHSKTEAEKQRQLEAVVRDLEELRRSKASQEHAHALELVALRQQLEPRVVELEQSLANRDAELQEAREAAELTLQQLHQAEEELEHYFLKARASDQLNQAHLVQLQRAQSLLARLRPDIVPIANTPPALAVEVLPELPTAILDPSLQTQALLSTYAASLERASALLERARRS